MNLDALRKALEAWDKQVAAIGDNWTTEWPVIEQTPVTGPKVEAPVKEYPNSCPLCGHAAYVGFTDVDCSNWRCNNFGRT